MGLAEFALTRRKGFFRQQLSVRAVRSDFIKKTRWPGKSQAKILDPNLAVLRGNSRFAALVAQAKHRAAAQRASD